MVTTGGFTIIQISGSSKKRNPLELVVREVIGIDWKWQWNWLELLKVRVEMEQDCQYVPSYVSKGKVKITYRSWATVKHCCSHIISQGKTELHLECNQFVCKVDKDTYLADSVTLSIYFGALENSSPRIDFLYV